MPSKRHKSLLGSYHIPLLTISLRRILATLAPCSQPVATALPKRSTQLTRSTREIEQFSLIKLDNSYENQTVWSVSYLEQLNLVKLRNRPRRLSRSNGTTERHRDLLQLVIRSKKKEPLVSYGTFGITYKRSVQILPHNTARCSWQQIFLFNLKWCYKNFQFDS